VTPEPYKPPRARTRESDKLWWCHQASLLAVFSSSVFISVDNGIFASSGISYGSSLVYETRAKSANRCNSSIICHCVADHPALGIPWEARRNALRRNALIGRNASRQNAGLFGFWAVKSQDRGGWGTFPARRIFDLPSPYAAARWKVALARYGYSGFGRNDAPRLRNGSGARRAHVRCVVARRARTHQWPSGGLHE
jgi:hypothetical protein